MNLQALGGWLLIGTCTQINTPLLDLYLDNNHEAPIFVRLVGTVRTIVARGSSLSAMNLSFNGYELPLVTDDKVHWWQHHGYISEDGSAGRVDVSVLPLGSIVDDLKEDGRLIHLSDNMIVYSDKDGSSTKADYAYVRVGS